MPANDSIHPTEYILYNDSTQSPVAGAVIEEIMACISVDGHELATFMCSPHDLDELAIGFLRSEGFIKGLADIEHCTLSDNGTCVDIWLRGKSFTPPSRRIVTSGCGGGVTFDDLSGRHPPLQSTLSITAQQVTTLMKQLHQAAELYNQVRGVHTSALSDGQQLLLTAQDVGRHNTIDRLWGKALKQDLATEGRILLASGRISSEMLNKAAKMNVPIVISRTSPTSMSVRLARAWQITVIGYARGKSFRVYSMPERVGAVALEPQPCSTLNLGR